MNSANNPNNDQAQPTAPTKQRSWFMRLLLWFFGLMAAGIATVALLVMVAVAVAYPNMPDVSSLRDYQPKLPLRVYSADGVLLDEFGEERRSYVPYNEIPKHMKQAILAIEDARFYKHGGIDYVGVLRAGLANFSRSKSQGASTITMQVARNVYLSSEKTFTRKIYEMVMAFRLEHTLTKDQILEIYLNQIYLGNRASGFAAAAETYFGKSLRDITLAEAAMLAGLPKAPSLYNPIVNPNRARIRQVYILDRMVENNFITAAQAEAAKNVQLVYKTNTKKATASSDAAYASEMARQMVFEQYGAEAYTRGLNVYTTISTKDQRAAVQALRTGILNYDSRRPYRGPEEFVTLPNTEEGLEEAVSDALDKFPDAGEYLSAVVVQASPRQVVVRRSDNEDITISGNGLNRVAFALSAKASNKQQIRRGAIVRIMNTDNGWAIRQLPEVEGALVSMDPRTGAILAMAGGFDFAKSHFNHVTQAYRQPGSTFKPFIYSAGVENGIMPGSLISDSPITFNSGGKPWSPKNYDGSFGPPLTMRQALAKSKNLVSVRIIQSVGSEKAQEWAGRFGFPAERTPPYLTLSLGANTVTPLELAAGYSVFANGGYKVSPYLISLITDQRGQVISRVTPPGLTEDRRAIPARNAFVTNTMMNGVVTNGTAARATASLGRSDLYGKTGTTNESKDAWFAGFQANKVAVVWFGFDTPRNLGSGETGGGLSLPIWIQYMRSALQGIPVQSLIAQPPAGLTRAGGDWAYTGEGSAPAIARLGVEAGYQPSSAASGAEEAAASDGDAPSTETAGEPPANSGGGDIFKGN